MASRTKKKKGKIMNNPTDTNQPDHNEEVLEMVTDTNQASEDRLRKDIEHIILTWSSEISGQPREKLHPETDQFVMRLVDLIRTEKLELLAEVREQTTIFKIKAHDKKGQPHLYEAGRGVPTEVLTKLEAEL